MCSDRSLARRRSGFNALHDTITKIVDAVNRASPICGSAARTHGKKMSPAPLDNRAQHYFNLGLFVTSL